MSPGTFFFRYSGYGWICIFMNMTDRCSETLLQNTAETSLEPMRFRPGLKDHFWTWTTALCWITPRGGEQAWAADTIENRAADAHLLPLTESFATLWHKLQCGFVLCPTLRTQSSVHRCKYMETACSRKDIRTRILMPTLEYTHTHARAYTHTHLRECS